MAENGVPRPDQGAIWEETMIHNCGVSITRMGEMTLIHLDTTPGRRITLKLENKEALEKYVSIIRGGLHVATSLDLPPGA